LDSENIAHKRGGGVFRRQPKFCLEPEPLEGRISRKGKSKGAPWGLSFQGSMLGKGNPKRKGVLQKREIIFKSKLRRGARGERYAAAKGAAQER